MLLHPVRRDRSLGRGFLTPLLAGALLLAALLSSSPGWHESLHHDAVASHACLVTLCANGQVDSAAVPSVVPSPFFFSIPAAFLPPDEIALAPAGHFSLLEHAPPAAA